MIDVRLRDQLLSMQREDLTLRASLASTGALFDGYHPGMAELHRKHAREMRGILFQRGWPGRSLVGDDGADAAWLLVQHATLDPPLMRLAQLLLEAAVLADDAPRHHLAHLADRIAVLEGRPQSFGTEHDWDAKGELVPLPIDDPSDVDERRRLMGLGPLAATTSRLRHEAAAEGERAPEDFHERSRDMERWAREVGWR